MKLSQKEWATLEECAHALASVPGALPKHSIEQELVATIRSGRLPARRDGIKIKYPAKGLYFYQGRNPRSLHRGSGDAGCAGVGGCGGIKKGAT
jgi:hypothetical protein